MTYTIDTATTPIGTLDELEPTLRALGYSHVRTMAGPVDLATFDPYGMRRTDSVNHPREPWRGTLLHVDGTDYLADAREATAPFLLGLFPLLRPSMF